MGLSSVEALRFLLTLSVILFVSRLLGALCVRVGSPRVIGEIGTGLVLGPTLLERVQPRIHEYLFSDIAIMPQLLGVPFWLGLGFLMFVSGYELSIKKSGGDTKIVFVLIAATTVLPFVFGILLTRTDIAGWSRFLGESGDHLKFGIVMGVAFAITSIPVISRIFLDLGVADTRFARVVLSVAGVHDLILWAVLALALPTNGESHGAHIPWNLIVTVITFALIVFTIPKVISRYQMRMRSWLDHRTIAGPLIVLWGLSAALGLVGTEFIFGAMAAGFLVRRITQASGNTTFGEQIKTFAISSFIPLYFALVGLQVNLASDLPVGAFLTLLTMSTLLQTCLVWIGARICGLTGLEGVNLAAALNAKGGPGIALATVAYQQKIIDVRMFAMLLLLAVLTSWIAGVWIHFCLERGWPLLREAEG